MERLTTWTTAAAIIAGLLAVPTARSEGAIPSGASDAAVVVQAVRPRWPIAREVTGRWIVAGEALAINTGTSPLVLEGVTLTALDESGAPVAQQTVATAWDIHDAVQIVGASGFKPAGSTTVDPGEIAIAYLAAQSGRGRPVRSEISFRFDRGPIRRAQVPLDPFEPGQRFAWPLRFDNGAWAAVNTPGGGGHWRLKGLAAEELFMSERFALDLVQIDARGSTSDPPASASKEDYYAWGEDVLAAGSGTVVAVVADRPDLPIGAVDPARPAGNHVVIQHGPSLFGVYAHLMEGSPTVTVGSRVQAGQRIGAVGNSGNTSEPHLHLHFADRWDGGDPLALFRAQGVPALFWNAQARRGHRTRPLSGSTLLEPDVVLP